MEINRQKKAELLHRTVKHIDITAHDPRALIEQISILHNLGIKVVMVHGGGPQLTQVTEAMGVPTRMVQGRRVTDEKAIDTTSMVLNGLINTKLLALCREMNIDAVGISGVDAGLIRAHKRAPVRLDTGETVDYGFVGDIDSIDTTVILKLLDATIGLRVAQDEERLGLDASQHGELAYQL